MIQLLSTRSCIPKIAIIWLSMMIILAGCLSVGAGVSTDTPAETINSQSQPSQIPSPEAPLDSTESNASPANEIPTPVNNDTGIENVEITPSPSYSSTVPGKISGHLLFLADSSLKHWRPYSGHANLLLNDVWDYSSSVNGQRIAVLQSQKITANGSQLFDLNVFEPKTRQIQTLLAAIPEPHLLSISPYGLSIAFWDRQGGGDVIITPSTNPSQPTRTGSCEQKASANCHELLWSPDSRELLWSDSRGIWISKDSQEARLAVPGKVQITDPQGDQSEVQVLYKPISWSPVGRFILVDVIPSASSVHWLVVIDTRTGVAVELPFTYGTLQSSMPSYAATWLKDGRLALAYVDREQPSRFPRIRIYQVVPTNDEFIVLDQDRETYEASDMLSPTDHPGIFYTPGWLGQTSQETISLALIPSEPVTPPALVSQDLESGDLVILHTLPDNTLDVIWSHSRADAIILDRVTQTFWGPAEFGPLVEMDSVFGSNSQKFVWLENIAIPWITDQS